MALGNCAMEVGPVSLEKGFDTVEGDLLTGIKCTTWWKILCGVHGDVVGRWMHWLGSHRALTTVPWNSWFSLFA